VSIKNHGSCSVLGDVASSRAASAQTDDLAGCDVFVLAGGRGTRVQSVLGDIPKLLAPVGDRPFLAFLLAWLRRFGARRVVLGLGYRADAVVAFLRDSRQSGIVVETVIEPAALGTAGALRFGRSALRSDPVLVMNGDSFVDADLGSFLTLHRAAGARGTLLCAEVDDAGRYGRVLLDDARISRFVEKDPAFRGRALVNTGLYLLSSALIDEIAAGQAVSLERDVFERLPAGSLAAYAGRFAFIDIGTPESLALVRDGMEAMQPGWREQSRP
jgi:mannose-1-phosphate guanylyltransferase